MNISEFPVIKRHLHKIEDAFFYSLNILINGLIYLYRISFPTTYRKHIRQQWVYNNHRSYPFAAFINCLYIIIIYSIIIK